MEQGIPKAREAVRQSIENVTIAMNAAGYKDGEWTLAYQNPPLPVAKGADSKWEWGTGGGTRGSIGGCGLADSTFDWIVDDLYPKLTAAMRQGIKLARTDLGNTPIVQIDTTDTFKGHRLCEKGTVGATNYQANQASRTPPWQKDNGTGTEWVTYVSRSAALFGNVYQASMPLHPNYWGQRALAACMAQAVEVQGSVTVSCGQDPSESLNAQGQPAMELVDAKALWVTASGTPVVQGIPNVGRTLTADTTGVFAPLVAYDYEYQWFVDGTPVSGATAKTYTAKPADAGKDVTVRVTATADDSSASATSDPLSISDIVVNQRPAISGNPTVGKTLTVSAGTYNVVPDNVDYQWFADGEEIPGETGTSFALRPADAGKRISVRVTVAKATYDDLVLNTAETAPVALGVMTVTGRPTVTGSPIVGQTLTADRSPVTFSVTPDQVSYRWFRDGVLIKGAESATYELVGDDSGKRITARVLGGAEGYQDAQSGPSSPAGPVKNGVIKKIGNPTIVYGSSNGVTPLRVKGRKIRFGQSVKADIWDVFSEWPNPADVKWFSKSGGKVRVIKDSLDDYTWEPTAKDIGTRVRVRIETQNDGYEQASATTAWYKIVKGKYATVKAPKVKGKPKVGRILKATPARFLPPAAGKVQYRWFASGKRIKGADGRTLKLRMAQKGKNVRVQAYIKPSATYLASQVKSAPVGPVRAVKGLG